MTRKQIIARIDEMVDEYAYADTWPLICQQEYERLCEQLYSSQLQIPQPKRALRRK